MTEFQYIIDRICDAEIIKKPFPHLEINDILSPEQFQIIIGDNQIHFTKQTDNDALYKTLLENNYNIQDFPGCVGKWEQYIEYLEGKKLAPAACAPVETIGITFRLHKYRNNFIQRLVKFMNGQDFHNAIKTKFSISEPTNIISAIQKNLSGYEISPHPDSNWKALTYLININKDSSIEEQDCHTHLLEFKDEYKYITDFWQNNPHVNRCWVPWNMCNTVKKIKRNNTMVIFQPASNPPTLHAVKMDYDHLKFQRTQIYGNLMYRTSNHTVRKYWNQINT